MAASRPRSKLGVVLLGVVVALAGLWSAGWFFASSLLEQRLDAWIAREADAGRTWRCAQRSVGGFPLRLRLVCDEASLHREGHNGGQTTRLKRLDAGWSLFAPKTVDATLTGPLRFEDAATGVKLLAEWERGALDIGLGALRPTYAQARFAQVVLADSAGEMTMDRVRIASLDALARPSEDAPNAVDPLTLVITANGVAAPVVDQIVNDAAPANFVATLRADHARSLLPGPLKAALERWRLAGGALTIVDSTLEKGRLRATATGLLQFDEARRVAGRIDARAAGFEKLLERFGMPTGALAIDGALSMFGRKKTADATAPQRALELPLPITLRNGRVSIGPIRTRLMLAPVYGD